MCGIVYYHNTKRKPVANKVLKRYLSQRNRGYRGFGVYRPQYNKMAHNTEEKNALKHLKKLNDSILLFHHRFPTSTANVNNACHPFSTKDYFDKNYVFVHNGVVSNAAYLRGKHKKLGIEYVSMQPKSKDSYYIDKFNDSEALMWEFALYLEGRIDKIEATGSMAIICYVHKDGNDPELYFWRNDRNPLKMRFTKNILSLASEGDGTDLPINTLHKYVYETGKMSTTTLTTGYTYTPPSYTPATTTGGTAASQQQQQFPGGGQHHAHDAQRQQNRSGTTTAPSSRTPIGANIKAGEETSQNPHSPSDHTSNPIDFSGQHAVPTLPVPQKLDMQKRLEGELKDKYKHYMKHADGIFDQALVMVLNDMELAEEDNRMEDVKMLEKVYDLINEDEFYISASSVHPDYCVDIFDDEDIDSLSDISIVGETK